MDDFLTVRFALVNVHPPELATRARAALDRIIDGRSVGDQGSADGRRYARRSPRWGPRLLVGPSASVPGPL